MESVFWNANPSFLDIYKPFLGFGGIGAGYGLHRILTILGTERAHSAYVLCILYTSSNLVTQSNILGNMHHDVPTPELYEETLRYVMERFATMQLIDYCLLNIVFDIVVHQDYLSEGGMFQIKPWLLRMYSYRVQYVHSPWSRLLRRCTDYLDMTYMTGLYQTSHTTYILRTYPPEYILAKKREPR